MTQVEVAKPILFINSLGFLVFLLLFMGCSLMSITAPASNMSLLGKVIDAKMCGMLAMDDNVECEVIIRQTQSGEISHVMNTVKVTIPFHSVQSDFAVGVFSIFQLAFVGFAFFYLDRFFLSFDMQRRICKSGTSRNSQEKREAPCKVKKLKEQNKTEVQKHQILRNSVGSCFFYCTCFIG